MCHSFIISVLITYNCELLALDDIGHGVRTTSTGGTPRSKQRGSSQGSIQSLGSVSTTGMGSVVGPAPTTKPPTPPQAVRTGGSLSKVSREYRTPPAVAPPQVGSYSAYPAYSAVEVL
jgi:hypothetical protein